ncbi:hypothetical protein EOD23_17095 [Mesorhizobium sp. USDA-HM6]|nr:hypothetical protein EOD23_17095 [Mesorhizobium sp. USDA-HM6]
MTTGSLGASPGDSAGGWIGAADAERVTPRGSAGGRFNKMPRQVRFKKTSQKTRPTQRPFCHHNPSRIVTYCDHMAELRQHRMKASPNWIPGDISINILIIMHYYFPQADIHRVKPLLPHRMRLLVRMSD